MKRDPHLHDLSRDHHGALVLARRAARAAASGDAEAVRGMWERLREVFATDLSPHFAVEEEFLLEPLTNRGETELVHRTEADHHALRRLLAGARDRQALADFGERLRAHVRFEERELFPAAERLLSAAELKRAALASRAIPTATRRQQGCSTSR